MNKPRRITFKLGGKKQNQEKKSKTNKKGTWQKYKQSRNQRITLKNYDSYPQRGNDAIIIKLKLDAKNLNYGKLRINY